ncbi:unnamed protein product, partial [Polarella glacialis]
MARASGSAAELGRRLWNRQSEIINAEWTIRRLKVDQKLLQVRYQNILFPAGKRWKGGFLDLLCGDLSCYGCVFREAAGGKQPFARRVSFPMRPMVDLQLKCDAAALQLQPPVWKEVQAQGMTHFAGRQSGGRPSLDEFLAAFWACHVVAPAPPAAALPEARSSGSRAFSEPRPPLLRCFGEARLQQIRSNPAPGSILVDASWPAHQHELGGSSAAAMEEALCCSHTENLGYAMREVMTAEVGCWNYSAGLTPFSCCELPGSHHWPTGPRHHKLLVVQQAGKQLLQSPFQACVPR